MKRWTRFCCFLIAVLMLISMVPIAAATETDENARVDFVLVLDCSASLFYHDPDRLCLNACESFVDQLPVQDARVGVIGFGYSGGNYYNYSAKFSGQFADLDMSRDASHVHEIIPLGDLSNSKARESYKEAVVQAAEDGLNRSAATERNGGSLYSPVIPALGAAVDMLEKGNSSDNNACIILITDGVSYTKGGDYSHTAVSERARSHGWPIYSIELNYATPDAKDVEEAQALLDEICAASGDRNVGREYCASPEDVFVAFQRIFFDLWKYPEEIPIDWPKSLQLPGEFVFSVPALTSEATVNVFGSGVTSVKLISPDGREITVTKNIEQENLIAVVRQEKYVSVKMICPKDGEWTCYVEGSGDASVLVNSTDLQEMGLNLVANTSGSADSLHKNDVVRVDAFFAYGDYEIHNHDVYQQTCNNARLRIRHSNGTSREYPMQADSQGYYCELMLNEFASGALTLQVILKDDMFRNGIKYSDTVTLKTVPMALELTGNGPDTLSAYVNSSFAHIDLAEIFFNPDNDVVNYGLECTDRSISFDYTVDSDYMTIASGLKPGSYQVTIFAKDPDMSKPLEYTMTLSVEDRPPVVEPIPDVELWLDHYGFQKQVNATQTIDLTQHIFDPDGVEMTYTLAADSVITIKQTGSVLELIPAAKGDAVVRIVGWDGVSEASTEFDVSVISGKAAFWRDNWIKFAFAAAVLVVIILILCFLSKNTRVKGVWTITFAKNDGNPVIANNVKICTMNIGRKKVFLLKDLLKAVAGKVDENMAAELQKYFGPQKPAAKIELKGVTFGSKGFVVRKIPKDDTVQVIYGGLEKHNKVLVRGGGLKFILQSPGELGNVDRLSITFK